MPANPTGPKSLCSSRNFLKTDIQSYSWRMRELSCVPIAWFGWLVPRRPSGALHIFSWSPQHRQPNKPVLRASIVFSAGLMGTRCARPILPDGTAFHLHERS